VRNRCLWVVISRETAVYHDATAAGGLEAGQNFHPRGLPRAILAQNSHDPPTMKRHADVVVGMYGAEVFVNVA